MTVREEVKEIELSHIRTTQGTERLRDIETLAKSISAVGLQVPLIVQHIPDSTDTKGNEKYLLVDGHRRFAALLKNKSKTARVIEIAEDMPGDKMQTIQLTANIHRLQLTAFEEAAAIKKLRDDGRETKDIAADLGLTPQAVARREQLNKLTPEWLKYIVAMREGSALSVAAFEMIASYEPSVQGKLLQLYMKSSHVPTVGDVKRELSAFDRTLKSAPWKLDDAILFPTAGACDACSKRSSCQSLLFDGETDNKKATPDDKCLDIACWNKKLEKFGKRKIEEAKAKHPNLVLLKKDTGWGVNVNRVVSGLSRGETIITPERWSSDKGYEVVKKGDKDAVPAMTINEKGLGSISYIKITKQAKKSESKRESAKALTPEEQLKIEQETLAGRRAKWVLDAIVDTVRKANKADELPAGLTNLSPIDSLLLLAATYKAYGQRDFGAKKKFNLSDWKTLNLRTALLLIWELVEDTINIAPYHHESDIKEFVNDVRLARDFAEITLKISVHDLEAEAIKAIPDPQPKAGAAKKAGKK